MSAIEFLKDGCPETNGIGLCLRGALFGAAFAPKVGALANVISDYRVIVGPGNADILAVVVPSAGLIIGGGFLASGVLGKILGSGNAANGANGSVLTKKQRKNREIFLGGMWWSERALFTSILVTGSIGSGKTSAAILPALEQLLHLYNEPDYDPLTRNPYAAMGGFLLDVKNEFSENVVLFAHKAGRNIYDEIVVIRPQPQYAVVRFQDAESKEPRYFYLPAVGYSSGSEAGNLYISKKLPNGNAIPTDIFTKEDRIRGPIEPLLREITVPVDARSVKFIGWRYEDGKLVKVSHLDEKGQPVFALDEHGRKIYTNPPKNLRFVSILGVDTGIRYNIVNNDVASSEAAARLSMIASLANNEGSGGDNAYWINAAKKHIGTAIDLHRMLHPSDRDQCSPTDIYELTVSEEKINKSLVLLGDLLKTTEKEIERTTPEERGPLLKKQQQIKAIQLYFADEWRKLDQKVKTTISSVISNMFFVFTQDPDLRETFAKPATISFDSCIQKGTIFCFLPGPEYETLAKVIGTALKIDFQSQVLARLSKSNMGKERRVLFMNDECQRFVVSGGGVKGDDDFMALCRQAKCININATQSLAWFQSILGKNTDAYLQNYCGRIWFQNVDAKTNQDASELCGIKEDQSDPSNDFEFVKVFSKDGVIDKKGGDKKKKKRFEPYEFVNLDCWESISFNKEAKTASEKVVRFKNKPSWAGSKAGEKEKSEVMRMYYQGVIENQIHKLGLWDAFSMDAKKNAYQATSDTTNNNVRQPEEHDNDNDTSVTNTGEIDSSEYREKEETETDDRLNEKEEVRESLVKPNQEESQHSHEEERGSMKQGAPSINDALVRAFRIGRVELEKAFEESRKKHKAVLHVPKEEQDGSTGESIPEEQLDELDSLFGKAEESRKESNGDDEIQNDKADSLAASSEKNENKGVSYSRNEIDRAVKVMPDSEITKLFNDVLDDLEIEQPVDPKMFRQESSILHGASTKDPIAIVASAAGPKGCVVGNKAIKLTVSEKEEPEVEAKRPPLVPKEPENEERKPDTKQEEVDGKVLKEITEKLEESSADDDEFRWV